MRARRVSGELCRAAGSTENSQPGAELAPEPSWNVNVPQNRFRLENHRGRSAVRNRGVAFAVSFTYTYSGTY